jgi:hypothetical protein
MTCTCRDGYVLAADSDAERDTTATVSTVERPGWVDQAAAGAVVDVRV